MRFRHGYLGEFEGTEYEASTGPDGTVRLYAAEPRPGFTEVGAGRFRRVVGGAEVGRLRHVRTVGVWKGAPVVLIGAHGSWLRAEYLGTDADVARQVGFERFEADVYQGWVAADQIADVAEEFD